MSGKNQRKSMTIASWMIDHRLLSLAIILIPSLILASALPKIEVYSRFSDLLPQQHEYIKNYNRMKETFGGANVVTMSIEAVEGDIFTAKTLQKIRMLTQEVDVVQGINRYPSSSPGGFLGGRYWRPDSG